MPLNSYTKSPVHPRNRTVNRSNKVALKIQREPLTLWSVFKGANNDITEVLTASKIFSILIPALLIVYGFNLLSDQVIPMVKDKLQSDMGYYDQNSISLVAGDSVSAKQQYLSKPGSEYFAQLQDNALSTKLVEEDKISAEYKGKFEISIPSLQLANLPVQANVNSGVQAIYDKVLEDGLAHMESTGLPISNVKNNIVVYGHSAAGDYFKRSKDPAAAFSVLNEIRLGDEIIVKMEGQEYKYKVSKTKIVKPYDLSIITGSNRGIQTLTLFTCSPAGNNAQRLVVVANPV